MYPFFQGKRLNPSRAAMDEMIKHDLDLYDILEVLENGYDCSRSKRSKGTIERCKDKKQKTTKVVVVNVMDLSSDSEVWTITHVGITSKRRPRR